MAERYEICLSGSGGQGLILAGIILAEAAGVHEGKHVAQSQSYGPEARGGASKAEVVISDEEIDYPMATRLDLLLAMNRSPELAYGLTFVIAGAGLLLAAWLATQLDVLGFARDSGRLDHRQVAVSEID